MSFLSRKQHLSACLSRTDKSAQIFLRILAAVLGGLLFSISLIFLLVFALPLPAADILFVSALFPPLAWPAIVVWSFAATSGQQAWRYILIASGLCLTAACFCMVVKF